MGLIPETERKLARSKWCDDLRMTDDNSIKAAEDFLTRLADARAFMLSARLQQVGSPTMEEQETSDLHRWVSPRRHGGRRSERRDVARV